MADTNNEIETFDYEADVHLPSLATTPRFLAAPGSTVMSQSPRSETSGRSSLVSGRKMFSGQKIEPEIVSARETPRRSLKRVCRGYRQWKTGLLDCRSDSITCFLSCIFPCYIKASIATHLDESQCVACIPCSGVAMRTKVRTVGGIQGSLGGDMCVVCCCPCLSISQMSREVDHMNVQPEIYVQPVKY